MIDLNSTALVRVNEDKQEVVVDSLMIAKQFGRRHKDVLKAIRNLNCSSDFGQRNFAPSYYVNEQGKKQPMYTMTRDGCVFLIAKLKGSEAGEFLERYIKAFNDMEKALIEAQKAIALYTKHTKRDVQIENSKAINAKLKESGGKSAVIVYNVANCKIQSGKPPKYWKNMGKADCLPTRVSQSAKEVLRIKHPQVACGMSLADSLVISGGDAAESISIGKDSQPLFQRIIAMGITPSELLM